MGDNTIKAEAQHRVSAFFSVPLVSGLFLDGDVHFAFCAVAMHL